jgi:ribosomal protein L11 methylase PrmA
VSPGDKMLDYGTGSGILAIAALKMGGAHAIGVDIDPAAISASEYNASLNNLKPDTLQVYVASADGEDPVPKDSTDFDVVVANILLNPLVELAGRITGYCKPGGFVGLSGILVEQVGQVKEAYSQYLEDLAVSYDNGWACVSGRKKSGIHTNSLKSSE